MFQIYNIGIFAVVLISILCLILSTHTEFRVLDMPMDTMMKNMAATNSSSERLFFMANSSPHITIAIGQYIAMLVLTLDLCIRFITCQQKKMFLMSGHTIIDILSIAPGLTQLIFHHAFDVENSDHDSSFRSVDRILEIASVFRVFRLLKLVKNVRVLQVLSMALAASKREMLLLVGVIAALATIYGCIIYYAEIYLDNFGNITLGIWWAIVTMTTVGYGDFYPKGLPGHICGVIVALSGILVLALPIPVIANNFDMYYKMFNLVEKLKAKDDNHQIKRHDQPEVKSMQVPNKANDQVITDLADDLADVK